MRRKGDPLINLLYKLTAYAQSRSFPREQEQKNSWIFKMQMIYIVLARSIDLIIVKRKIFLDVVVLVDNKMKVIEYKKINKYVGF